MHPWRYWPFQKSLYNMAEDPKCETNLVESDPIRAKAMHETLLQMNPRWKPYSWETTQHTPDSVSLGISRFGTGALRHVVSGDESVSAELLAGEGVLLNDVRPEFNMSASIEDPGHPYALTFDYSVLSGRARFVLFEEGTEDPVWAFDITRVSDNPKHLEVRINIRSRSVTFRAKALRGGETRLAHIQLRRLNIPEISPRPADTVHNPDPAQSEPVDVLTEGEKEALEAVGYLQ
ncbi:MAG: hypothetical protein VCC01_09665 [Candidatus Hydrogenedentota bacterium]